MYSLLILDYKLLLQRLSSHLKTISIQIARRKLLSCTQRTLFVYLIIAKIYIHWETSAVRFLPRFYNVSLNKRKETYKCTNNIISCFDIF